MRISDWSSDVCSSDLRDPLAFEHLQHEPVRAVERRPREALRPQPALVADDTELVAGIAQPQERRDHAGDEAQLVAGIDLVVGRLLDQGAVAVNEEDRRHVVVPSACSARTTTSFCPGVPIVIRSASPSCGIWRMSRTTTPAASSRAYATSASAKRPSRKLPCDG